MSKQMSEEPNEELREQNEELNEEVEKEENDDDFSWGGCIAILVIVVASIWVLAHFNPSEEDHRAKIAEVTTEAYIDGYRPSYSSISAMSNIKYHSIGILSWTSTKYHGRPVLVTAGILGFVYPFIDFR